MIKAVFFDIDGTLLSHRQHCVPESTRRAVEKLKQRKIQCVAATGRHITELEKLPVEIAFDGYITLNGQLCLDSEKKTISGNPITGPDKETLLRLFEEKTVPILLVGKDSMYINFVNAQVEAAQAAISTAIPETGSYGGEEIFQVIAYLEKEQEAALAQSLPQCRITRWNALAVDIISHEGGKAAGIKAYLRRNGIGPEETIAFGDGENDVDMLQTVGIGVAMGNAVSSVKAAADYVTESVDEDGIEAALKYWKVIDQDL